MSFEDKLHLLREFDMMFDNGSCSIGQIKDFMAERDLSGLTTMYRIIDDYHVLFGDYKLSYDARDKRYYKIKRLIF